MSHTQFTVTVTNFLYTLTLPFLSARPQLPFPVKQCQGSSGPSPASYQHPPSAHRSPARTTVRPPPPTRPHAHALQVLAAQHVLRPHAGATSFKPSSARWSPAHLQHRSEMSLLRRAPVPTGGQGRGATYARARRCARARLMRLAAIPAQQTHSRVASTTR